jgi:hypothetical protein
VIDRETFSKIHDCHDCQDLTIAQIARARALCDPYQAELCFCVRPSAAIILRAILTRLLAHSGEAPERDVPHPNAAQLALERRRELRDQLPPVAVNLRVAVRSRNLQALGRYSSIECSTFCIVAIAAFNAVTNNCSLMFGSRSRPFTMRAA